MTNVTDMAWIARDPKTGECFACCAADPKHADDAAESIAEWKNEYGATVELVTKAEARAAMMAPPPPVDDRQVVLFA